MGSYLHGIAFLKAMPHRSYYGIYIQILLVERLGKGTAWLVIIILQIQQVFKFLCDHWQGCHCSTDF